MNVSHWSSDILRQQHNWAKTGVVPCKKRVNTDKAFYSDLLLQMKSSTTNPMFKIIWIKKGWTDSKTVRQTTQKVYVCIQLCVPVCMWVFMSPPVSDSEIWDTRSVWQKLLEKLPRLRHESLIMKPLDSWSKRGREEWRGEACKWGRNRGWRTEEEQWNWMQTVSLF